MNNNFSIAGIKQLYVVERPTDFDYHFTTGSSLVIDSTIEFTPLDVDTGTKFVQKKEKDKFGTLYKKTLEIVIDTANSVFNYEQLLIVFEDNNGFFYIGGYDQPFTVARTENDFGEDNGDTVLKLSFESQSYEPIKYIDSFDVNDNTTIIQRNNEVSTCVTDPSHYVLEDDFYVYTASTRLIAGANISLSYSSTGTTISSTGGGGSSIYTGATPSTISLGGIPEGYPLTGKTYSELFEQLLVVYLSPAFGGINITGQDTLIEVGDVLAGSKTFTWGTTNSGNIVSNSIIITDVNGAVNLATGLANDFTETVDIGTITNTSPISQSWRMQGMDTHSVSFVSSNFTVNSIYPYYYGKVSSGGAAPGDSRPTATAALVSGGTKVVENSNGTITIPFSSSSDDYCWFATPSTSTNKTKWYVDALNNGNIGGSVSPGGNLFPDLDIISVTTVKWSGINFDVYITNYQSAITSMEMRNS